MTCDPEAGKPMTQTTFPARSAADARRGGVAAALAAVFIWALVPVGTRFFVLRTDPLMFNILRFAASGAAALPLCLRGRPWRWPVRDRILLCVCALFAVPGYNMPVALGARAIPAGELGLLIATEPVFIVALSSLLERRPISQRVLAGSALALAGAVLTSGSTGAPLLSSWASTLQVLGGAFSWSCYTVLVGRLNARHGTFAVTGAILVIGSAALMLISLPLTRGTPWPDVTTTAMLAAMGILSSLLGFLLWNHACAALPAERVGLFVYLIPIVCLGAGAGMLGESLSLAILAGGVLTIAGVWLASRTPPAGAESRRPREA
jgi:drug/metabolite transporter (DMT)-like permease